MNEKIKGKIWYREPYVWLVILFPLSAVIAGIITTWLAIISYDGLVVDDYYKYGLEINKVLDRDRNAEKRRLRAMLYPVQEGTRLEMLLESDGDYLPPDNVEVKFLHPTRNGFDQTLNMRRVERHKYESELPELIAGTWYVQISADDWRIIEYYEKNL